MTVMMSRNLKRWICGLLIGVFASAQVAIAAHACSGLAGAAPFSSGPDRMVMNDGSVDPMLSNVCVGHCQDGLQSADQQSLPAMPAAAFAAFYTVPLLAASGTRAVPRIEIDRRWASSDPPHAILHCCMRD